MPLMALWSSNPATVGEFTIEQVVSTAGDQGTTNAIGFDGIWKSPEKHTIIVEIKTTDAYRIALDTVAGYRDKLAASNLIEGPTSILVVVGRQDTGELEAQVRGSRHAWDIRLISAEALIKLVQLKENSDDPETGRKIRGLLTPFEYTRLDRLIDTMFTAATDIEGMVESDGLGEDDDDKDTAGALAEKGVWQFTASSLLNEKRERMIA